MRRLRLLLLGFGCAALIVGAFFLSRDAREEAVVELALRDVPEVAREGNAAAWAWLRTGPTPRADVEATLSRSLKGRRGWSHNAMGWNYNSTYDPPWWFQIRLLRDHFPDRRPILWVEVSEGRATLKEDRRPFEGPWTTVRLEAMASYEPSSPALSRWTVRR